MDMSVCVAPQAPQWCSWIYDRWRLWRLVQRAFSPAINPSVTALDDTQFIRARVDAAFRMIDNTVTELNRNPINTQVDDWHNTLFGRRFDAQAERHRNIKPRFEDLLVIRTYTTTDQTGIAAPDIRDVRFYCTFKRIEKKGDRYRNKDRDILYKIGNLDSPGGRFANCYDLNPPTLMITLNVLGKHSEIQICPWFLTNVRGYQLKDLSSLPTSAYHLLSKIALPVAAKAVYTPIDSFSLMDKTILHELTHTDQSNPVTVDLGRHPYGKHAPNTSC
jgi:hypothetical protein